MASINLDVCTWGYYTNLVSLLSNILKWNEMSLLHYQHSNLTTLYLNLISGLKYEANWIGKFKMFFINSNIKGADAAWF